LATQAQVASAHDGADSARVAQGAGMHREALSLAELSLVGCREHVLVFDLGLFEFFCKRLLNAIVHFAFDKFSDCCLRDSLLLEAGFAESFCEYFFVLN